MMNSVFFFYTLALLVACVVTALISGAAYVSSRKRVFLYGFGMFVAYAVETTEIFFNEYLAQNVPFDADAYYGVSSPLVRTAAATVLLTCMWAIVLDLTGRRSKRLMVVPPALLAALSLGVLAIMPVGALRQWAYYTLRQAFVFGMCAFGLAVRLRTQDEALRARLEHLRRPLVVVVVLNTLVLVEDTLNILVMPMSMQPVWLLLYLSERNFSENAIMLFFAYGLIRCAVGALSLRVREPAPTAEGDGLTRRIEGQMQPFCERNGLSKREAEILALVLEGKSNQQIADELYLALGTVKTHVHNIMVKCDQRNRKDLTLYFWQS